MIMDILQHFCRTTNKPNTKSKTTIVKINLMVD